MTMKYYSTQRPVTPGSFPKPKDNPVLNIVNFDEKTFVPEIGCKAWGYVEYEKPLTQQEIKNYEMR